MLQKALAETRKAKKYRGRNITIGRYIEDVVGVDPNSAMYGKVSGVIDFYNALALDPALLIGKSVKAIKYGKSIMNDIDKAFTKGDFEKIPGIIQGFIDSPKITKTFTSISR